MELELAVEMEWVQELLNDIEQEESPIFTKNLKSMIQKIIDTGTYSKLDPKEFRCLYIKKIYQDQGMNKQGRHLSI